MTTKNLSALADKARIAPTKSKDKFCHEKFSFSLLHSKKKFKSRQNPSAPDLFIRPASIVAKGSNSYFQDLS